MISCRDCTHLSQHKASKMNTYIVALIKFSCIVLTSAHSIIEPPTEHNSCVTLPISLEAWKNFTHQISALSENRALMQNDQAQEMFTALQSDLRRDQTKYLLPDKQETFEQYMLRMNLETQRNLAKLTASVERLSFAAANYDSGPKLRRRGLPDLPKDTPVDFQYHGINSPSLFRPTDIKSRPSDCADLLVYGNTKSGVYEVYPFSCKCSKPVKVYCDMETDGGGWTIFLSRKPVKKRENFTRSWNDYKNGFGSADGEYWLGNENLHRLTTTRKYHVRFEATDQDGRFVWGQYSNFMVANEVPNKYKVTMTGFDAQSTMYDRLTYINNLYFSTIDVDNDSDGKKHCSQLYKTGWWFKNCYYYLPTGAHGTGDASMVLNPWSKKDATKRSAVTLQMKIRPIICSEKISRATLNSHNCLDDKTM